MQLLLLQRRVEGLGGLLERVLDALVNEGLDLVALLPVFEGGREEAALCALLHQGDVVLESPQLFELALLAEHLLAAPPAQPAAHLHAALGDDAAGDLAVAAAEDGLNRELAYGFLLLDRAHAALHGGAQVIHHVVDDLVLPHLHTGLLCGLLHGRRHAGVEGQHEAIRSCRQVDVGARDLARRRQQEAQQDAVLRQLGQRRLDCLSDPCRVDLEHHVDALQLLRAILGLDDGASQRNAILACLRRQPLLTRLSFLGLGRRLGLLVGLVHREDVARLGHAAQAYHRARH
mmetsp:Transcript_10145/g.31765  ORF Transcript_10145/g.31765 Transcript_10145/m.31765 type:complete len:289 (+) Transcript_10145:66-932(+)